MTYVALLRGINVGGNNRVEMKRLVGTFEHLGFTDVNTYINSGNVIFRDGSCKPNELADIIEAAIEQEFGFVVKVLVRDIDNIQAVVSVLPDSWVNDITMKSNVMFLWEQFDNPKVLDQLTVKPEMEEVKYVPGTLLWRVDRDGVTRSGMLKMVGTELYKHMTIRNCNTVRKLLVLMKMV